MHIGKRLKQARLEAGLSQRQLCGDTVTRNMLSLIENGNARPSMDTLQILAARLGKPLGYFLDEQAVTSPNQTVMEQARTAPPAEALELLQSYQAPDPVFDAERWLLEVLACLQLAEQLGESKPGYAATLLERAAQAGQCTIYYTPELERRRLLLCHSVRADKPAVLAQQLPDWNPELLLRAQAALERGEPARCAVILDAADTKDARWHYLRGEACFGQKQFSQAVPHYLAAEAAVPLDVYPRLEACFRELEDYKQAYAYACKQRQKN